MVTNELRKAAKAVFLATSEAVAQDLSDKLNGAAHEIDRLRNKLCVAERKLVQIGGQDGRI